MERKRLRLATRQSPLALAQAELVKRALEKIHSHLDIEIIPLSTQGDRLLDAPLSKFGGKGLFIKELEKALRQFTADIAVHSVKDLPVKLPKGLIIPVITQREDPRDVFVSLKYGHIRDLPPQARVGTSSLRRHCQIKANYPALAVVSLRGNVQTRLRKLAEGEFDAIILAAAGLHRLGLQDNITHYFEPEEILPAVGQGALAIECRVEDKDTQHLLQSINCETTHACVLAERAVNSCLNGGCHAPVAMYALRYGHTLSLRAMVGDLQGRVILRTALSGHMTDPYTLGHLVAEELLAQGAAALMQPYQDENADSARSHDNDTDIDINIDIPSERGQ
jgi:hydroxymethylbilane synthase